MSTDGKRELITKTFVEMLNEMPFEAIRVQDIAVRAGISKSTFYRLFRDKFEVMNWVYLEPSDMIVNTRPDLNNWKEWTYVMLEHVKAHKAFYRNIISYHGQNSFFEFMVHHFKRNSGRQIRKKYGKEKLPEKLEFAIEAFSTVNAFTLEKWIADNFQTPPELVIEYVESCIPECIREYYE